MAERESGKSGARPSVTPEEFSTVAPPQHHSSGDYSYTVEVVGTINNSLGKLTEAVENLKGQVKDHGSEIKAISADIHAAKTVLKMIGWFLAVFLTFAGWAANKGIDAYVATHQSPPPQQKP